MVEATPTKPSKQVSVKADTKPTSTVSKPIRDMKALGKLGGRPRKDALPKDILDGGQAFEKASEQVAAVTLALAERVRALLRDLKKSGNVGALNQVSTSFGIFFDKLHKLNAGQSGAEVEIPPSLAARITTKLTSDTQGNQQVTPQVAVLTEDADSVKAAEPADPVAGPAAEAETPGPGLGSAG